MVHSCQLGPVVGGRHRKPAKRSTSFSSVSWLSGSIQKACQCPLPVQKLLVGTHLGNGAIFQHHNPISLRQDVERVSHKNPCLGKKGVELHS